MIYLRACNMQMLPIILDNNFNRIAMIDDFISLIWTSRYYSVGDFELCADISRADVLQTGYYVTRQGDDEHLGIIESVKYQHNEDMQEMIIATGRFLPAILARRVIASQTQVSGTIANAIQTLINDNAINPTIAARRINGLTFSSSVTSAATMDAQYTGENLLSTIESICETYSIGFDCMLTANNGFNFSLYEGVDRSYNQSVNPYIVFSDKYDNLLTSEYTQDFKDYTTDVLVGGEGEGMSRTMVWSAKQSQSDLNRYEKFLNAQNAVTNENIITQETYEKQLQGLGLEQVTAYTTAFTGEVDFSGVTFGVDLNVGDIVTIENARWGMFINSRLIEVIESVGENGVYTAVPTFGT